MKILTRHKGNHMTTKNRHENSVHEHDIHIEGKLALAYLCMVSFSGPTLRMSFHVGTRMVTHTNKIKQCSFDVFTRVWLVHTVSYCMESIHNTNNGMALPTILIPKL